MKDLSRNSFQNTVCSVAVVSYHNSTVCQQQTLVRTYILGNDFGLSCRLFRVRLPRDGDQHPGPARAPPAAAQQRPDDDDPGAVRRAPRAALQHERAHRPRRPHRRPRLGALHRKVPRHVGAQVLSVTR